MKNKRGYFGPFLFAIKIQNRWKNSGHFFENIKIGDKKRAYVKNIRDDNKLDISLQKIGQKVSGDKVYDVLIQNGGKLPFTYKSEADDINARFGISKKAFKASLTKLLAEDKIVLEENSIRVK